MSWHVPLIIVWDRSDSNRHDKPLSKEGLEPPIRLWCCRSPCLLGVTIPWRQVGLPTTHLTFNLSNNGDGIVTVSTHAHWLAVVSHFVITSTSGGIDQNRTDNQGHSTAISLYAVKLCRLSYYPVYKRLFLKLHLTTARFSKAFLNLLTLSFGTLTFPLLCTLEWV